MWPPSYLKHFSMNNTRRHALISLAGAAAFPLVGAAHAQRSWPARPFRLVVPFPPGGLIDSMMRIIGPKLATELGQAVVIDNKPGAGGVVGAADVARATPDGYTLLAAAPPLTTSPALSSKLPYRAEQLVPIGIVGRVPNVLLVNPSKGINSVDDLIARAKASPGKLNYASNGNGTSLHLSAELFKSMTGTNIVHVPYKGAAAAVTALISNEVDMMFENLPSVLGQIQSGAVKALAVTTRTRSRVLRAVPSLSELKVGDFNVSAWYGLAAPTGTPPAILSRLETALEKVARDPAVAKAMSERGADVAFLNQVFAATFLAAETATWKRVATSAKISID